MLPGYADNPCASPNSLSRIPGTAGRSRRPRRFLALDYLGTIYAVEIAVTPEIVIGKPEIVLEKLPGMRYDPSPDATRFIRGRPRGEWTPQTCINVVMGAVKGQAR